MTFGRYLLGLLTAVVALAPVVVGATALRRRLLPRWSGPPAWVANVLIGLSMFVCVSELLGVAGLYRTVPIVAALAATGLAAWWFGSGSRDSDMTGTHDRMERDESAANRLGRGAAWAALVGTAVLVAEWSAWTVASFHHGIESIDSRWYHLPAAARFVQDGSITSVHYFDNDPLTAFYPVTSELLHGFGMMVLGNDLASPVMNLGWLALALLASWCIGRPFGVAPVTMLGVIVFLATPGIVTTQPGAALTDVVGLALLLSTVAILVNAERIGQWATPEVFVAALAAGLAIGTKYTFIPAAGALTLGVIAIARRGSRVRTGAAWLGGLSLTGALWYLRNLVVVGNPIPALELEIGPLALPSPPFEVATNSVSEYVLDAEVWDRYFVPGLGQAFGLAWWALLGLSFAGLVLALVSGPGRLQRMLALVGIAAAVTYVFQPQSLGVFDVPIWFQFNLRYGAPALILGLVLLPLVPRFRRGRWAWSLIGGFGLVLAATQLDPAVWPTELREGPIEEPVRRIDAVGGLVIGVLFLVVGAAVLVWRRTERPRSRRLLTTGTVVTVVALVIAGFAVQDAYLDRRYLDTSPAPKQYAWARDVSDARIAIVGNFLQYPFYGNDLSNHVEYVGRRGANGAFSEFEHCEGWRRALNRGDYDYVVVAPAPEVETEAPPALAWTETDPATSVVVRDGSAALFRIEGTLDPQRCRGVERIR